MKSVLINEHGGKDVIEYGEIEDPEISEGEVLIEVKAGALNHLDIWVRKGLPGMDLDFPHIPGADAAGIVKDTGERVEDFKEGDHVVVWPGISCGKCEFCRKGEGPMCISYGILGEDTDGVHSELSAVPEENLIKIPEDKEIDWEVAAASPLVFGTSWRMLIERGNLKPSESILVLGASGGVGHASVQIAKYTGAEVYATASTEEKLEKAKELGADYIINYKEEDFDKKIKELTDRRGVDAVVDHIGQQTWKKSLNSLAKGGRILTCGSTTGPTPETQINQIFWNQLKVIGSTMATWSEAKTVLDLVWDGKLKPEIRDVLPMSETGKAHSMLEDRQGFGKVVVTPD